MLDAVKDYLKITWDDEDAALLSIIERGKAYLNDLTGAEPTSTLLGLLDRCFSTIAATCTTTPASISRRTSPESCCGCSFRRG